MELMSLNVSTQNVEKVIRPVLQHIAGMNVENLPKPSTLIQMTSEMKGLACQQLAEQLTRTKDLTLHNDGTSKSGQHYGGFQVSLPESSYSLGLCEMLTGSADLTLKSLQMILADIEAVAGDGIGDKILAYIKNTMSSNLHKLFLPPSSEDQEGLIGRRIKHRWIVDGEEQWYLGIILDVVPGTDDCYNVQYDNEDQVLSLNLLLDIEQGDLEFVDRAFYVVFVHSVCNFSVF